MLEASDCALPLNPINQGEPMNVNKKRLSIVAAIGCVLALIFGIIVFGGSPASSGDTNLNSPTTVVAYAETWTPHSFNETVKVCPAGKYAIGGGFSQGQMGDDLGGENKKIQVTVSAPVLPGGYQPRTMKTPYPNMADRWVVRGYNNGDSEQFVRVWVVCANVGG